MSGADDELTSYYEAEAELGLRPNRNGRRVIVRDEFVAQLRREGRRSVIDLGAGPGRDGVGFVAAGLRYVGVDLANGNARLAAESGLHVVQGSILALPIAANTFDGGWSMSTLMHLDGDDANRAVQELVAALRPGSPFLIGLWGRELERLVVDARIEGHRRPFHLRSFDHNHRLVSVNATVERSTRWEHASSAADEDWDYQLFWARSPDT